MANSAREVIDDFLAQRRIAFVGVSRDSRDFSRKLWTELRTRGYDLAPVHPEAKEIDGVQCSAKIGDVRPVPEAALLMVPAGLVRQIVDDCEAAGIRRIWMHRASGKGSVDEDAVRRCHERGISVVAGECPFMFLSGAGGVHRIHGWWRRVTGTYPA